jgi:hypothetical protein
MCGPATALRPDLGSCWIWNGNVAKHSNPKDPRSGYGRFLIGPKKYAQAHRYAYELLVGPIPTGLVIDHLCMVKRCVNPAHMEPTTRAENTRRARPHDGPTANVNKATCPQGHLFDASNTYMWQGARYCRICRRLRVAAYNARRRAVRSDG